MMRGYPVRRVCAWCGRFMGWAEFKVDKPGCATHGMCEECMAVEMAAFNGSEKEGVSDE